MGSSYYHMCVKELYLKCRHFDERPSLQHYMLSHDQNNVWWRSGSEDDAAGLFSEAAGAGLVSVST